MKHALDRGTLETAQGTMTSIILFPLIKTIQMQCLHSNIQMNYKIASI